MHKKIIPSFFALNGAQFCSALNDNVYKLLLVFMLINLLGAEHSNTILSIAGAVFVIPFLLFASLSGTLADRYSKRSIIYFTRFLEIFTMILGIVAFALKTVVGSYIVLFLMATQSALFSPCKYGILPEIVRKDRISRYNGILTATTYLAIILGTFLASFLADITDKNYVLAAIACVVIAIAGTLFSLGLPPTEAQCKEKKVSARFISVILKTLDRSRRVRYLFPTLLFSAYFLFMGAYTQLNIIPYAMQSLNLSEIQGGYLFLMTAIGIGIGSFLAGRISGEEVEIGLVPIAAFGVAFVFIGLYWFHHYFYLVVPLLVFVGICGGFYIVPIDAFIQIASPPGDRGQNLAAGNFLSFIGVIIASFLIAFLGNTLGLSAAQGFRVVGIITLIMAFALVISFADQVLRTGIAGIAYLFWNLRMSGREHVRFSPPVLLVGQRRSWLDTIITMATLPRLIYYIVPIQGRFIKGRSLFYRLLRVIPIEIEHFTAMEDKGFDLIEKELSLGHSICLMQPTDLPHESLHEWEVHLKEILKSREVPIVPIHISRYTPPAELNHYQQFKTLFKHPIIVSYGNRSEH